MTQPSRHRSQQPLDTLQSMINGVLLETGKALRSANKKGPQTIGQTNDRLKASIPGAMDKFHLALDELESDIVRALAVLSRDLDELRARQIMLNKPKIEEIEDVPDVPDVPDVAMIESPDQASEHIVAEATELPMETTPQPSIQPDLIHDEEASSIVPPTVKEPLVSSAAHSHSVILPLTPLTSITKVAEDVKQADPPSVEDLLDTEFRPAQEVAKSTNVPEPAAEESSSNLQEINLDSIFDDVDNTGGNELSFNDDLNFAAGGSDNPDLDFGDTNGDLDLSSFGDPVHTSNTDVSDILKGFEEFGAPDNSNDFSTLDLGNISTSNAMDTSGGGGHEDFGMSGGDLDLSLGLENNESTFDDLLDGIDFGDAVEDSGQDMMEHGELDDAFFTMGNDG